MRSAAEFRRPALFGTCATTRGAADCPTSTIDDLHDRRAASVISKPSPTRSRPTSQIAIWASRRFGPVAVAYAATPSGASRQARAVVDQSGRSRRGHRVDEEPRPARRASTGSSRWKASRRRSRASRIPRSLATFAAMYRAVSPSGRDAFLRFETDLVTWDVTDLLPAVECPTLVMHPSRSRYLSVTNAQRIAAGIPGAQPADRRNELLVHASRRDSARLRVPLRSGDDAGTAAVRDEHGRGPVRRHRELDRPHRGVGRRVVSRASARARRTLRADHRTR